MSLPHVLVHKAIPVEREHDDNVECWCEPYILTDPHFSDKDVVKKEMERQDRPEFSKVSKWIH